MKTAHAQYYKGISENKGSIPEKIAKNIINNLHKNNIYPDTASKLLHVLSPFQGILSKMMYKKYRRWNYEFD